MTLIRFLDDSLMAFPTTYEAIVGFLRSSVYVNILGLIASNEFQFHISILFPYVMSGHHDNKTSNNLHPALQAY